MSVFTDKELEYLAGQRLGRIATVGPDGQPHVVPTTFRYNAGHDAIDVGGMRMSQTKKLRDVQRIHVRVPEHDRRSQHYVVVEQAISSAYALEHRHCPFELRLEHGQQRHVPA